MRRYIRGEIDKLGAVLAAMAADEGLLDAVAGVADACGAALEHGRKVLFAGNGGSAADAQHLAAELIGRLCFDRPGLPALALTADTAALTAIGNDYGFEQVFARQVDALGAAGDVLVGISTSGRSRNLVRALERARARGLVTVGLTGAGGGDMGPLCDHLIAIPSGDTQKIQEGQILVGHVFCALIERRLFAKADAAT